MEGDWTPTKTNLFYSPPKEVGVSSSFKIKDFLNYVSGKEGAGRLVKGLDDAVKKVRNHEEWRLEYMTLQMRDQEMMKKGREEGREEGREYLSTAIKRLQRGDLAETLLSDGIDENTVKEAEEIVLSFRSRMSDIV